MVESSPRGSNPTLSAIKNVNPLTSFVMGFFVYSLESHLFLIWLKILPCFYNNFLIFIVKSKAVPYN